jgi:DNA polymerase III epsilon subunit-like protein
VTLDLSRCWTELPIAVIDTETTGLAAGRDQICEIAAVRFEGGRVTREYATLVDPGMPIPPVVTAIHGITDEMVRGKPCLEEAAAGLWRVCRDAIPCAFNAPFDRRFLHARVQGTDCPAFNPLFPWLDVYTIVASPLVDKYEKGKGRLKLSACCMRHGVPHESQHRARGDCLATGLLLWRLHEKNLVKACSAERLLQWAAHRRTEQDRDHARYRARMDKGADNGRRECGAGAPASAGGAGKEAGEQSGDP